MAMIAWLRALARPVATWMAEEGAPVPATARWQDKRPHIAPCSQDGRAVESAALYSLQARGTPNLHTSRKRRSPLVCCTFCTSRSQHAW